ncbi:GNAT family N-acetyltransferase [Corynebacterium capitovis]|uniref:GNAT family N-acetyltransferase n=1 Tax=Corynebacterium capitovis TaxID=131081 RepID=UPI00037BE4FF|nr:N-acetyltransferase [Corynebacterium capitovis]
MTISLRRLSASDFVQLAPALVDIYIDAMGYSRGIHRQRVAVWRREVTWPGFTAVAAVRTTESSNAVVGLAYGFIGNRDRWWDQQLIRGLREAGGPSASHSDMLSSYFEVAEVHVNPVCQGQGIGRRLMEKLLRNAPARWVLLSTPEVAGEDNAAFGLYRKMGFVDILRGFYYAGDPRPFAVLGRPLPLDTPAAAQPHPGSV